MLRKSLIVSMMAAFALLPVSACARGAGTAASRAAPRYAVFYAGQKTGGWRLAGLYPTERARTAAAQLQSRGFRVEVEAAQSIFGTFRPQFGRGALNKGRFASERRVVAGFPYLGDAFEVAGPHTDQYNWNI
jgi:hypothetical protein